jgi:hypothetical protein
MNRRLKGLSYDGLAARAAALRDEWRAEHCSRGFGTWPRLVMGRGVVPDGYRATVVSIDCTGAYDRRSDVPQDVNAIPQLGDPFPLLPPGAAVLQLFRDDADPVVEAALSEAVAGTPTARVVLIPKQARRCQRTPFAQFVAGVHKAAKVLGACVLLGLGSTLLVVFAWYVTKTILFILLWLLFRLT